MVRFQGLKTAFQKQGSLEGMVVKRTIRPEPLGLSGVAGGRLQCTTGACANLLPSREEVFTTMGFLQTGTV
jgi:hypothetical protein